MLIFRAWVTCVSNRENHSTTDAFWLVESRDAHRLRLILTELFPWKWFILRDYVMGFFPVFPRIRKCFVQLAEWSRLCKRIVKISPLFYTWMKHIMSEQRKKLDFIENVKRKVASNPRLWFIASHPRLSIIFFSFLVAGFLVSLTFSIILATKLGQESPETKGRCGYH